MNTNAVVRELSRRTGLSSESTQRFVNEFLELITENLEQQIEVRLGNFGIFKPTEKAPRTARNLKRDENGKVIVIGEVLVPGRIKVEFKPGHALKERAERPIVVGATQAPTT
ncbi:MAG: hypothetical protein VR70_04050 [Rhodospirillaceae bacterium BRH_c57]|nr:MAG: hypothetical protein VR70_04050 [Rhodospirillaceae bacterium BRH_c57]